MSPGSLTVGPGLPEATAGPAGDVDAGDVGDLPTAGLHHPPAFPGLSVLRPPRPLSRRTEAAGGTKQHRDLSLHLREGFETE